MGMTVVVVPRMGTCISWERLSWTWSPPSRQRVFVRFLENWVLTGTCFEKER